MFSYQIIWKSKLEHLQGKEGEIIKSHIEDKIPIAQLAVIYNCSRRPLIRIIENNGYKTRPSSSPKLEGNEDNIIKMYVEEQLTVQTIRKKIGCSYQSIQNFLKRNNIKLRNADESRQTEDGKVRGTTQKLKSDDDLQTAIKMYEDGECLARVGAMFNITASGLRRKFLKLGITLKTQSELAKSPLVQQRKKETVLKNYGVENPMQNPKIYEKSNINRYKFSSHTICGKKFSHLQGYEPQGIQYLIEKRNINVDDILSGKKVPKIRYKFKNKNKTYFPDLYVENKNLLIEVKCKYTYENQLDLNISKREAALKNGYNYLTIIFENNGRDIVDVYEHSPS